MFQVDFDKPVHVYFMGIGGISMSGLAEILLERGFRVSGSDARSSAITLALEQKGIRIRYGQRASNITSDIDLIVYTAAISPSNPEYVQAEAMNIPMLSRAELLGQIMRNYATSVAVAGTHGKTTTTSMLTQIFMEAELDPTVSVGGILPSIGGNIRVGSSGLFLTEACEYTNSFLHFFPTIGIILNIEPDHLDFFHGIEEIRESFAAFARLLPPDGALIIGADTPQYEYVLRDLPCRVITFALEHEADVTAEDILFDKYGHPSFTCKARGFEDRNFYLRVPGLHNVSNALSAIAAARLLGIDDEIIVRALAHFTGTARRFEYKGEVGGVIIIDDYAHHPTEIDATLKAADHYPHKSLWCVFQPHTFTRTKALLDDFAAVLSRADHVILADIYAARETNTIGISSEDLMQKIREKGGDCVYFPSFGQIEEYLLSHCVSGDLILTVGAGDVVLVGDHLLGKSS